MLRDSGRRMPGQRREAAWLDQLGSFVPRSPGQLKTKSDQWFADARFLLSHHRFAAAVYLGGFVIELLLKAMLWPRRAEPPIGAKIFSTHDLFELLELNRVLERALHSPELKSAYDSFQFLANWTVHVRYNPKSPSAEEARDFWRRLEEVRKWLHSAN